MTLHAFAVAAVLVAFSGALAFAQNASADGPAVVTVERTDTGWQLLRNDEPFVLRGVGGDASRITQLADIGGNALRTWGVGPETQKLLDDAHANGIGVILNIWLPHARGANDTPYSDQALRDRVRGEVEVAVEQYKDHPALLIWSLGNEAESENTDPAAYWAFLEDIAGMVQELDPNHPVMTTTSELGRPGEPFGQRLRENCPSIDIWGINSYGGMFTLAQRLDDQRANGWAGPHIVMEFGPIGQWETYNKFGEAPVEQTSTEKALQMALLWGEQVVGDPNCLGGFAFLWGQKQEETHTWFGMFVDGRPTGAVDALQRQWTGAWPDNLAPVILALNGYFDGPIAPNSAQSATVIAFDPEGRPLKFEWTLELRQTNTKSYGESEDRPESLNDRLKPEGATVNFAAPAEPGVYRLFVLVEDEGGKVATANVPIKVQ